LEDGGRLVGCMIIMLTLLTYEPVGNLNFNHQYSIMLGRQERMALSLLIGVAVVVLAAHLVLSAIGNQPFAREYSVDSSDGELVFIEGKIDQVSVTNSGEHRILKINDTVVFVPAQALPAFTLQKGERIAVYGLVQTYQGKKEIVVRSKEDIRIT
jgi:uncharacterized SAM-binding protein YcdF (DUF218 family)